MIKKITVYALAVLLVAIVCCGVLYLIGHIFNVATLLNWHSLLNISIAAAIAGLIAPLLFRKKR